MYKDFIKIYAIKHVFRLEINKNKNFYFISAIILENKFLLKTTIDYSILVRSSLHCNIFS